MREKSPEVKTSTDFQQGYDHSVGKERSLQQMMVQQLDSLMQKSEI